MKRSEMLKRMNTFIETIEGYNRPLEPSDMDTLLFILEEAGMLPPPQALENVTARIKYYVTFETENDDDIDIYPTNASEYLWEEE